MFHVLNLRPAFAQSRLDKGEFNRATTKVLHFISNPEAEARKEIQAERIAQLESEVATIRLQSSLSKASPNVDSSQNMTGVGAALEAKIVVLEQKVALKFLSKRG